MIQARSNLPYQRQHAAKGIIKFIKALWSFHVSSGRHHQHQVSEIRTNCLGCSVIFAIEFILINFYSRNHISSYYWQSQIPIRLDLIITIRDTPWQEGIRCYSGYNVVLFYNSFLFPFPLFPFHIFAGCQMLNYFIHSR